MAAVNFDWVKKPGGLAKLNSYLLLALSVIIYNIFGILSVSDNNYNEFVNALGNDVNANTTLEAKTSYGYGENRVAIANVATIISSGCACLACYHLIFGSSEPRKYLINEVLFLIVHAILGGISGCCVMLMDKDDRLTVHEIYVTLLHVACISSMQCAYYRIKLL